jgi:superfamily II DNA or RNA helicase
MSGSRFAFIVNLAVAPVVFIVPAIELLKQTQKEFERYLRFNGEKVRVGIAGGGLCDLNMQGINVITYQTALIAFDKKYIEKGNKVVDDANVDGPKSTAQLQKELEEANKKLIIANNNATRDLAKLSSDLDYANKLSDKETDLKKKKTLASAALNLEKQFNKEKNTLIKTDLAAYKKALASDAKSAFGGIVALNHEIDENLAQEIAKIFYEVIIAPSITNKAREILSSKKNLRILIADFAKNNQRQIKTISGGFLVQDFDNYEIKNDD